MENARESISVPRQAVILAGGFGTRMSKEMNPLSCKSLIDLDGQPMLGHLIDTLKESGINNFIFKANDHCFDQVKVILESKNLEKCNLVEGVSGFRDTPYFVREFLQDRFLLICGHHYVTRTHIKSMLESSKSATNVITVYPNSIYPLNKEWRIVYEDGNFRRYTVNDPSLPKGYWYARNPYIVNKDIIQIIHNDNYQKTFSYYMFKSWENGVSMNAVEADMPPEFDYDNEFKILKEFYSQTRRGLTYNIAINE